jgi:site-specific DNA-methyltransferase (adenine-specific)/site-specific DNA-methyltransferase (cytosine-N4-specific)
MYIEQSRIFNMDCFEGLKNLYESYGQCVDCVVTSPPYAQQRLHQYGGIDETLYPQWTVEWMDAVGKVLKPEGSVFIVIRPHIKNGVISDYVLKTRLSLRNAGWYECEELIWIKPDSPPLGSVNRPRRAWESILWFSKSNKPYCDPKANGTFSNRIGFENNKFEHGGTSHIHAGQRNASIGIARCKDYVEAGTSKVKKGIKHEAMYPIQVPEYLIKMCTKERQIVLDPFIGSGTTAEACIKLNRGFVGYEIKSDYYKIANAVILDSIISSSKETIYKEFVEQNQETINHFLTSCKGD